MQANENFDLAVIDRGGVGVISVDARRSLIEHRRVEIEMQAAFILESTVMPKDASDDERARLALVGAMLKVQYGLCVVAQEAYFIPVGGKGKKKTFTVVVSYKGLTKKKREYELKTGDTLFQGAGSYLSTSDIKRLGLHNCRKCGGKGTRTWDGVVKPCKGCDSKGQFDPHFVLYYELEYNSRLDGLAAKEIGVEYFPMKGQALWQPCDNVAQNRSPQWMVEKNAYKDVIRRLVPITGSGPNKALSMEHSEDKSTEEIAVLCEKHGVEYDDLHSLASLVRNSLMAKWASKWKNEEEIIAAIAALGLEWRLADEEKIKYRIFGYKLGEYPIAGTGALNADEKPGGILVMNVIFDVGGRDKAHEIARRLFDKDCSIGLTRNQLNQIHESVLDGVPDGQS